MPYGEVPLCSRRTCCRTCRRLRARHTWCRLCCRQLPRPRLLSDIRWSLPMYCPERVPWSTTYGRQGSWKGRLGGEQTRSWRKYSCAWRGQLRVLPLSQEEHSLSGQSCADWQGFSWDTTWWRRQANRPWSSLSGVDFGLLRSSSSDALAALIDVAHSCGQDLMPWGTEGGP